MEQMVERHHQKGMFIGLLAASALLFDVVLWMIWHISRLGLAEIHPMLPDFVGFVFVIAASFILLPVLNMMVSLNGWGSCEMFSRQQYFVVNFFFPVAVWLGKPLGITRRVLEGAFVAISNMWFAKQCIQVPADKLLVVTPHCLQLADCKHKITRDVSNCKRCGGCNIGDLVKLSEEYGFFLFVATGGTLARQIIKEKRPKAVLAIACERDLMSGIQDVYPLPAVGILNVRPNGPCYNTRVNMEEVRAELEKIILPRDEGVK